MNVIEKTPAVQISARSLRGLLGNIWARNIGIDLGTANTVIYVEGEGIRQSIPSFVAKQTKKSSDGSSYTEYVFGEEAKVMAGRNPGEIQVVRPLKDGVIADFKAARELVLKSISIPKNRFTINKPIIVICVPSGSTPVERRAIQEAAEAGARKVFLIEEPIAAAIGADLPVTEATGSMIVDIGGGTTEVAVISLGGIVYSRSVRIGGDIMDEAIMTYIRKRFNLLIGETTSERIKKSIGSALIPVSGDGELVVVKGRDIAEGVPKEIVLSEKQVAESLRDIIMQIIAAIKLALECTPPELSSDIIDRGIMLSGGGALLKGLAEIISEFTGLPVFIAQDPLNCVALGIGKVLENMDAFISLLFTQE